MLTHNLVSNITTVNWFKLTSPIVLRMYLLLPVGSNAKLKFYFGNRFLHSFKQSVGVKVLFYILLSTFWVLRVYLHFSQYIIRFLNACYEKYYIFHSTPAHTSDYPCNLCGQQSLVRGITKNSGLRSLGGNIQCSIPPSCLNNICTDKLISRLASLLRFLVL